MSWFRKPKSLNRSRRRVSLSPRVGLENLEVRQLLATLYVATSGSDAGSGAINSPLQSIQEAVTKANSGDQILVATGTYTYQASADHFGPKNQFSYTSALGASSVVALMGKQLTIEGGFTTSNWVVPNATANPTVIDGQGTHRGIFAVGSSSDSSPTSLTLENFTIQNCLAQGISIRSGADAVYGFGGGIFIDMGSAQSETAPWVFQNLVFRNDTAEASGALGDEGGRGAGGAVALRYVNNTTFNNVLFDSNQAVGANGTNAGGGALGGALHVDHSNVTGTNLTFTNNTARSGTSSSGSGKGAADGESADGLGGAVTVGAGSTVNFDQIVADNNQALGGSAAGLGGGAYGGAFFAEGPGVTLSLTDAVIQGNKIIGASGSTGGSADGAAIETHNANLIINRTQILGNSAQSGSTNNGGNSGYAGGGGLYLTLDSGTTTNTITNTVIAGNTLAVGQGASPSGGGGAIVFAGVNATLSQVTLDNNTIAPSQFYGQSLLVVGNGTGFSSNVNLDYSILSDETSTTGGAIEVFQGNKINFNTDLSFNNANFLSNLTTSGSYSGLGSVAMQAASTQVPSLYNSPGSPNWDYHLNRSVANPAVDGAVGSTATVDLDNNPRVGIPDLGAYEAIAPRVDFAGPVSVGEGGVAQITVVRRGDLSQAASVQVAIVSGGTAVEGTDYQSIGSGDVVTVNFAPYVANQIVSIQTLANSGNTAGKTIDLSLSLPTGSTAARLGVSTSTVTILSTSGSPVQTETGFDVTNVQPIPTRKGIVGAIVQFSAPLTTKAKVGRRLVAINLARAFILTKVSGKRSPHVLAVKYNATTNSVTVHFTGPILKGSSANLNLVAGRLTNTSGQALTGTTVFTLTA